MRKQIGANGEKWWGAGGVLLFVVSTPRLMSPTWLSMCISVQASGAFLASEPGAMISSRILLLVCPWCFQVFGCLDTPGSLGAFSSVAQSCKVFCMWMEGFQNGFPNTGGIRILFIPGLAFFFSGCAGKAISWCVERKFREFLEKREIQEKKKKAKTILALSLLVKSLGKFSGWEVFLVFVLGRWCQNHPEVAGLVNRKMMAVHCRNQVLHVGGSGCTQTRGTQLPCYRNTRTVATGHGLRDSFSDAGTWRAVRVICQTCWWKLLKV